MKNPVTDRLKLVETIDVDGLPILGRVPLPLFDQVIPVLDGFSQEVFRRGAYQGAVRPTNSQGGKASNRNIIQPIKARKGDVIYRVTLTPQPDQFVGTIQSKDKYQRMYEMSIELVVSNPTRFLEWYHQSKDPANWVILSFKKFFEQWASGIDHDKLISARPSLDTIVQHLSDECGIKITQPKWSFRIDPIREREWEIRHHAELRMAEITYEHDIKKLEEQYRRERERAQNEFDRDEKSRQYEFNRTEKLKNRQNEAHMQLLSETVKELMTMNRERIREAIEYNGSVKKNVLQESLRLLSVFSEPVPENEEVIDSIPSYGGMPLAGEEDVNEPDTRIDLPVLSKDETDAS